MGAGGPVHALDTAWCTRILGVLDGSAGANGAALFREQSLWLQMVRRAMAQDFSWTAAARRYLEVYREAAAP